ncbi:MAG: hypothetical protein EA378_06215 [Phycisphaerales bacterium]|nr:MAG: hypothetical protein EA378_06215 [Phycisphaerales bacterium]
MRLARPPLSLALIAGFALAPALQHAHAGGSRPLPADATTPDQAASIDRSPGVALYAETVHQPGADWVRLRFDPSTHLPEGYALILISEADGATQLIDADELARWRYTSAYFNGPGVRLELLPPLEPAAPSLHHEARVVIANVESPEAHPGDIQFSICGPTDDRDPTSDPRIGRFLPAGCTAFLIEPNGLLSAAHCVRDDAVVQFNVPPSGPGGELRHPDPADQYPVDPDSVQSPQPFAPGNDWAYFGLFPNATTGLGVREAQGPGFTLAPQPVAADHRTVRVPGYGLATGQLPPELSRTLTVGQGPLVEVDATRLVYQADTTGGSSGSPVIDTATGDVLAIHGSAGCDAHSGAHNPTGNTGTAVWTPTLRAAIADPRGVNRDRDCDGDGMNDFDQIAAGLGTDCNGNGILDACENLAHLDCNGDGFPDACDGRDCDDDGINDACAIAWGLVEDCNNNGIPDSCDLLPTPIHRATDTAGPIDAFNPVNFTITDIERTETDVTLTVFAAADVNSPSETLAVFINGTPMATLFHTSVDCDPNMATDAFTIPAHTFNTLIGIQRTLAIAIVASPAVDDWRCGNQSRARVELSYFAAPFSVDTTGDGRPDECPPLPCGPADIASSSGSPVPDGRVNVADLNHYINIWLESQAESNAAEAVYADLTGPRFDGQPDGRVNIADLVYYLDLWLHSLHDCN